MVMLWLFLYSVTAITAGCIINYRTNATTSEAAWGNFILGLFWPVVLVWWLFMVFIFNPFARLGKKCGAMGSWRGQPPLGSGPGRVIRDPGKWYRQNRN